MSNHRGLLAGGTGANHLAGLAFGVVPWDKYNHGGGEGSPEHRFQRLSGWPPSLPTESQLHLEENTHLSWHELYLPKLAGKTVTAVRRFLCIS
jgi:hypothetical protein